MILQSLNLTKILRDQSLLIDLIDKLLSQLLTDTHQHQSFKTIFHCKEIPSISVRDYLKRIGKFANCSSSVFVIALIYIDRLQQYKEGLIINYFCIHRLLITCMMVGAKFADDFYYKNEFYAKIGGISRTQMNNLELQLVKSLNHNLYISEDEFLMYLDRLDTYYDTNPTQNN